MYWRETAARPSSRLPTRGVSATLACVMLQWVKRAWARAVQIQLLWPGNAETCFHFWTLGWELGPGVGLGASVSLPAQAASVHLTTAGKPRLWASFHMKHPIKYIFLMSCGLWDHRGSALTGHVPSADTRVPEARSWSSSRDPGSFPFVSVTDYRAELQRSRNTTSVSRKCLTSDEI